MLRREGSFAGAGDLEILWRAWLPEHSERAHLFIAHDAGEHGDR